MNTTTPQISEPLKQSSPELWTMRDVARFIKCSVRTVSNLQKAGLPFVKIGHLTRFDPPAVTKWMGLRQER